MEIEFLRKKGAIVICPECRASTKRVLATKYFSFGGELNVELTLDQAVDIVLKSWNRRNEKMVVT